MKNPSRILVIRFRRVGDAILSVPLCSSLRKTFPEARIDYVLNKEIAPLFLHHPDIDGVIPISKEEQASVVDYLKRVRNIMKEGKYDIVIDTRSTVKTLAFNLFSMRTPYRIGRRKRYNILQNYRVDNLDGDDIVKLTLKLLTPLEKEYNVVYDCDFRVYITEEERNYMGDYLTKQGVDISKPIVLCAVATRIPHKNWKREYMIEVLKRILALDENVQLIFNYGGREEQEIAEKLHGDLGCDPRIFSNVDAKNLRELAALTGYSTFFFGNEGGPRHLAQAMNVPAFAVYPPGIRKFKWLPNSSERFQGIELADISQELAVSDATYQEKFDAITVDEVWKRLKPMLEQFCM